MVNYLCTVTNSEKKRKKKKFYTIRSQGQKMLLPLINIQFSEEASTKRIFFYFLLFHI